MHPVTAPGKRRLTLRGAASPGRPLASSAVARRGPLEWTGLLRDGWPRRCRGVDQGRPLEVQRRARLPVTGSIVSSRAASPSPRWPGDRPGGALSREPLRRDPDRERGGGRDGGGHQGVPRLRGVEDVTLTEGPGEAIAFLGPNGASKTAIRLLLDLIRPDPGRSRLFGMGPAVTAPWSVAGSAASPASPPSTSASPHARCSRASPTREAVRALPRRPSGPRRRTAWG